MTSLPKHASEYPAWKLLNWKRIAGAGIDPEAVFKWLKEIEDSGATFEKLQNSGAFLNLDIKVSAAVADHTAHGDLGLDIQTRRRSCRRRER